MKLFFYESLGYDPIVRKDSRCFEEFGHCSMPLSVPGIFARGFEPLMPSNTQTAKGYVDYYQPQTSKSKEISAKQMHAKSVRQPLVMIWNIVLRSAFPSVLT